MSNFWMPKAGEDVKIRFLPPEPHATYVTHQYIFEPTVNGNITVTNQSIAALPVKLR